MNMPPRFASRISKGLCATLALLSTSLPAQDLFSRKTTEHVPDLPRALFHPLIADFDGDGDADVLDFGIVYTNFGGLFLEITAGFTGHRQPYAVLDLDGDGRADVVDAARSSANTLGVSFNRFPFPPLRVEFPFLTNAPIRAIAVADFDGDGDADIVVEDTSSFTPLAQVENLGGGRFQDVTATRMPTARVRIDSDGLHPSDFDGDGDLDLIALDTVTPSTMTVMRNLGGGVFAAPDPTPFGSQPFRRVLGLADVDGDGDEDLFVEAGQLLENQGGTFVLATVQPLPLIGRATAVRMADIDHDGDRDVWVEANGTELSGWFENVGPGLPFVDRLTQGPQIRREAVRVELRDLDGDTWVDVIAVGERIEIHRGQPNGRFVEITPEFAPKRAYGDYDGDGLIDALDVVGSFGLAVQLNDGAGGYVEQRTGPNFGVVEVFDQVDLDGNGTLDLLYQPASPINGIAVAFNDGTGTFTGLPFPALLSSLQASRFGDVDGDGDPDLVATLDEFFNPDVTRLFRNDGGGVLTIDTGWVDPGLPGDRNGYAFADADGDGDLDLLSCGTDDLRLLANDGTGSFADVAGAFPPRFPTTGLRPSELRADDFDADGDVDVLALYFGVFPNPFDPSEYGAVFLNDGSGTFSLGQVFDQGTEWTRAALGDVDGDGDPDLAVGRASDVLANLDDRVELLLNDGQGGFATGPLHYADGERFLFWSEFVDVDGDGDLDAPRSSVRRTVLINRTTDLRLRFVPQIGHSLELEVAQPDFLRTRWALFILSPSLLSAPLPIPGLGVLTVDPTAGATVFNGSLFRGAPATLSVQIPNSASFAGRDLFVQAVVDPSLLPRLTAALRAPIMF